MILQLKKYTASRLRKAAILFSAGLLISLFMACEKNITVSLPDSQPQIVVEGYIEDGQFPWVVVTKSDGFFNPIDSSSLQKLVISNALVTVSDGLQTDTLPLIIDPFRFPYLYYKALHLKGEIGKTYALRVVIPDGQVLTATTSIAPPIPLDSTWFKVQEGMDSLGFVWGHLTDPDTVNNCYRWLAKRATEDDDYIAPGGSVFEDRFINGKSFDFGYARGHIPNSEKDEDLNEEAGYYKVGDTIYVKFCTIDYANFYFWRTAETQSSTNGNPFASPSALKGNIKGGLGIWGGYAVTFDTIYAKR